jgi:hypothetical protein
MKLQGHCDLRVQCLDRWKDGLMSSSKPETQLRGLILRNAFQPMQVARLLQTLKFWTQPCQQEMPQSSCRRCREIDLSDGQVGFRSSWWRWRGSAGLRNNNQLAVGVASSRPNALRGGLFVARKLASSNFLSGLPNVLTSEHVVQTCSRTRLIKDGGDALGAS